MFSVQVKVACHTFKGQCEGPVQGLFPANIKTTINKWVKTRSVSTESGICTTLRCGAIQFTATFHGADITQECNTFLCSIIVYDIILLCFILHCHVSCRVKCHVVCRILCHVEGHNKVIT